jgi:KaiC/GvpD/RAD55 family RecA-like ATPase
MSEVRNADSGKSSQRRMLSVAASKLAPDALPELPYAIDAEQSVLGGLMIAPSSLVMISDRLTESDFYRRDHKIIFRAISELIGRGTPVDAVTLVDWFETNGLAELIGGSTYLYDLNNSTPSAANIVAHADIVRGKSLLRQLIDAGETLASEAKKGNVDSQALLEWGRTNLARLSAGQFKHTPLAAAMTQELRPFTAQQLDDAAAPQPHAFQAAEVGLFPVGEVTVIGGDPRVGKTSAILTFVVAFARGKRVGRLSPMSDRSVVIFSAEDDDKQYARKIAAHRWLGGDGDWINRLRFQDLSAPGRELVQLIDRRAEIGPAVEAIIATLRPLMHEPCAPALLIFETASTLTLADEDNAGHKAMIAALRLIARTLEVAVVLVHHTSQAAGANLPTLNVSTADIRGATALIANSRQCLLLVNLGSEEDPHPENDARTKLRDLVAPGDRDRITVLICLDSSKSADSAPIFLRWRHTPFGPALEELTPPAAVEGKRWRKVREMLSGKIAEARAEAKDAENDTKVRKAVAAVERLQREGKQASARAVSGAAGHGAGWAERYLAQAVERGLLATRSEKILRTQGDTTVYFIPDDSWDADA